MPALVVSDLHLGAHLGFDLARREAIRARLLEAARGADQVVLLGDVLELREQPLGRVLELAYPLFEELGAVLGDGARVVLVPGNHDHHLATPLLERGRLRAKTLPLGLEQTIAPRGPAPAAALARRLGGAELVLAYPGIWLRPDVYATHGHYLDCHLTIPRLEVLGVAAVRRLLGDVPKRGATPSDYETVLAPVYAFSFHMAQAAGPGRRAIGTDVSSRVWAELNGGDRSRLRARVLGGALIPLAVGVLNRTGFGPLTADLSGRALYRAGVEAMGTVVERLGIEAEHVLFGHTHRAGPLPADDPWRAPGGARLMNAGCWIYDPSVLGRGDRESPYWPGRCIVVPDAGPPELRPLLAEASREELREAAALPA